MTRQEALEALSSDATETRLRAARHFSQRAVGEDVQPLRVALAKENVPWIRRALNIALAQAERPRSPNDGQIVEEDEPLAGLEPQQIYAKAAEEVAEGLIHELAPVVGLLRVVAPKEIGDAFGSSQTRGLIDQLHSLMTAIRAMKKANAVPDYADVNIAALVGEVVDRSLGKDDAIIQLAGPQRLDVSADRDQLGLAVGNGLKNALEAVRSFSRVTPPRIVITWGNTQTENFLVIKDSGPGFRGEPARALKLGVTTKGGHIGYGLALARQAMMAMQGDIILKNDEDGAHFEIRWFRENENPTR